MVTKPTGRSRGRPEKPKELAPKGSRGRPSKLPANDPDRYLLAFLQSQYDLAGGKIGRRKIIETWISFQDGSLYQTPEDASALMQGRPFRVLHKTAFRKSGPPANVHGAGAEHWHQRNAFRPRSAAIHSKWLRWKRDFREWLETMSELWTICFSQNSSQLQKARSLAASIDENSYFERIMKPILLGENERFQRLRRFIETGDTTYWDLNRLRRWPEPAVCVNFGRSLTI
jgi:hypothetical protein